MTVDQRGRWGWLVSPSTVAVSWRVPLARLDEVVAHEVVHVCLLHSGGPWRNERATQAVALRWLRGR